MVRAEDNAVSGLEGHEALENGGRGGVRGRDDGADDTHRLRDLSHAELAVIVDNAAGLDVPVGVVDVFKLAGLKEGSHPPL